MQSVLLDSRLLAAALYYRQRQQLELQFRNGKRYLYFRVPPPIFAALLQADSKGEFFNRNIRNRFACRNLATTPAPIVLARQEN